MTTTGSTQLLCRLDEVPEGGARGFTLESPDGRAVRVFAIRRGDTLWAYVNSCPHRGTPLDWRPHEFLDRERRHIVCATHGAVFQVEDGVCIAGPCPGDQLAPVPLEREGDRFFAPRDLEE